MTNEEAIKVLRTESVEIGGNAVSVCRFLEALDMAISAIRKQDVADKDVGKMTNAQKIRSMSDEELAEFLWDFNLADVSTVKMGEFGPHMFRYRLKEWLQQPAEEDDHDERKENEHV